ncbi:hypothetical protein BH23ACT10_BH23ACT10_34740 [soil metagenome]
MQPSSPSPALDRIRAASAALEVAPSHIVALLVLASCACAGLVALWWTARPHPAVQPTVLTAVTPSTGPPQASAAPRLVVVHVSGAVRSAGVYELTTGARVIDAIEAAGGVRKRAGTDGLNLARVLQDGEQIHVPAAGEQPAVVPADGSATGTTPNAPDGSNPPGRVSLNTASQDQLETLPGVGPVLGERIIAHRERSGGFSAVEDLLQIEGIGDKTFAQLRDLVSQ